MSTGTTWSQIVTVYQERVEDKGEDAFFYNMRDRYFEDSTVVAAVFDGCGGLGAKKYPIYDNRSGAYVASRDIAGATAYWTKEIMNLEEKDAWANQLKTQYENRLRLRKEAADSGITIKGSMTKEFPTTAVCSVVTNLGKDLYEATWFWAGDSRGYFLDERGLHLLTKDDCTVDDPMQNLSDDGILTNVISASAPFEIHESYLQFEGPGVVICATDGCFNYLQSPMHFEYMLLCAICDSRELHEIGAYIKQELNTLSGDDFSMTMILLGGGSYPCKKLGAALNGRLEYLEDTYIRDWKNLSEEEQWQLWEQYRDELGD